MRHLDADTPRFGGEMNFDLETAGGLDRLIAVSHHAQQKVCATIVQSSLIEHLLDQPDLDRAAVKGMLSRIMAISYSAAEAVTELQHLVLEHLPRSGPSTPQPVAA